MQDLDFLKIATKRVKPRNEDPYIQVFPKFVVRKTDDLMIRGRDFYAAWSEEKGCWSTEEQDVLDLIDIQLNEFAKANKDKYGLKMVVAHMWDSTSGSIDAWHKYVQKQMRDNYHNLDEKIIFSNDKPTKSDYSSKSLNYPLEKGDISAYDKLISTLYSPEEREKIEWGIGAVVSGDSKDIQKFLVFRGDPGTGKSTIINIIQQLFDGYWEAFDAEALGSSTNSFALEPFKNNPLLAIQHDGNLSRIDNNARINSVISHETMSVNTKNKAMYSMRFNAFLIVGTNKPVKITDAKSGLIRRLIDITPSGKTIPVREYRSLLKKINFELGAIAYHCLKVYEKDPGKYDHYIPTRMLTATNDFYNFIYDNFFIFKKDNGTTMKAAWELYKAYCEEAKVSYPMSQRVFKEELTNYFEEVLDRYVLEDGTRVRTYYHGFKTDKFEKKPTKENEPSNDIPEWLQLKEQPSIFDDLAKSYPAQYNSDDDRKGPKYKWKNCKTVLSRINTRELHWVKVPINHIIVDFDIKNENGEKDFNLNAKAASEWPETYAELSQGGQGLHLHYIYEGDPTKLESIFAKDIEIKVYSGDQALRRRLSLCNDLDISKISTGLPLKKEKKTVLDTKSKQIRSEKSLRKQLERNLNKEIHGNTTQSVNFIVQILNDAYNSDLSFDISDMKQAIIIFAANSTHNSEECLAKIDDMHFCSKDREEFSVPENYETDEYRERPIAFYDVEVFPNFFLVNWKEQGEGKPIIQWKNPNKDQIESLISGYRLIGFNNRNYDNHMIYGCLLGYDNEKLYKLSSGLVNSKESSKYKFKEAFNISYTDIYDYCAKKQSLKKWEIELGLNHLELGLPWDQPVPEELWDRVADYCDNDVISTEALFNHTQADFAGRKILAMIAGGTVNDTTNTLTTKLIFGKNRAPQDEFIYTDLSEMFPGYTFDKYAPKGKKSKYRGEFVGEGGYVYAEPGIYHNVALLDIASMHPHSMIALEIFGKKYTARFIDLVNARIAVKHRDRERLRKIFNGVFAEFADADETTLEALAYALKIAINSTYGLTSAGFPNPFKDPRNIDNIVAKRGALFMVDLKHAVQDKGFTVAHIKTDSIKIPDATPEIIQFVMDFGKDYGYTFEHEATYDRMCLVNDAVYIAKYSDDKEINGKHAGQWTPTGTQFQVPYVFKTLFSHEQIEFDDLCETKSATSSLYLDMNEGLPDVTEIEKKIAKLEKEKKQIAKHAVEIMFDPDQFETYDELTMKLAELDDKLESLYSQEKDGHKYQFIGKVGRFTPMLPGSGGGILVRDNHGKFAAATGTKGYRWLESETVKGTPKEKLIDFSYYKNLANEAIESISQYGDFNKFAA